MPVVEWTDVACVFDGRPVFSGFSGALNPGERVRLTGPSGSGKTTFFNMLLGFTPPAAGAFRLEGRPYDEVPESTRRRLIGYVPQEPDFGTAGTVREALRAPFAWRLNRAFTPSEDELAAQCERFRLPPSVLDEAIAAVSGGEKQRLACLLALLLPRKALLLDEPFSALDAETARTVAAALAEDPSRAILYATHADPVPGFATREVGLV